MTFGDPREFAIEAYHEPSGPEWAGFGRMAIDIQGVRIGNIREAHCSLFHAVNRFRQVCSRLEELWFESFVGWFEDQVRTTAPPFFPINPFAEKHAGSA